MREEKNALNWCLIRGFLATSLRRLEKSGAEEVIKNEYSYSNYISRQLASFVSAFLENLKNWICTFCCFSNNWQVERLYLLIQHIFHIIRNFKVIFLCDFAVAQKKVLFFLRTRDSEFLKLWHSINICNKKNCLLYIICFWSQTGKNLFIPLFYFFHERI